MKTQNVSVVSIHPDPAQRLELDIKHILTALGPAIDDWIWCVRNLDWLGDDADTASPAAFNCRVDEAGEDGLWVTSQELLKIARSAYQTIEGEFLAFPEKAPPPISADQAELAILAIDGEFFDVYAKDPDVLARLRTLKDVRDEDPSLYFEE